jgi:hypothetical protein
MNRRSFLTGLGLTPVVAAVAATPTESRTYGTMKSFESYASGVSYFGEGSPTSSDPQELGRYLRDVVEGRIGRISSVKGDPGERLYAECCGDGRKITVLFDGVEQPLAETADEIMGTVTRAVKTPGGNMAVNHATGEILKETVHGDVKIVIGEPDNAHSRLVGGRFTRFPA